ncbi:beta-1,4-galactosyltransferase 4-like [Pectinophora gossypiella]|uniref:beta-1,4-galactosyltransferase 4-like n=1 Tax=Pectinophora gossypiella TaxID=13191 RepID=UPI00214EA92B|nr:beta-1,4-galactosyltransferase 4-like [Pectinophora gossypiella]
MALTLNFRVLMSLLGVVVILNFSQFLVNFKKGRPQKYPKIAVFDVQDSEEVLKNLSIPTSPGKREEQGVTEQISAVEEKETFVNADYTPEKRPDLEPCPQIPPGLGPEGRISIKDTSIEGVVAGGYHKTPSCVARQKVAIIVPYRGHLKQLNFFLHHLHPFMMKQQAEYQVFVVEYGNKSVPFNLGQLYNIGFNEARKQRDWECLILHEPHLIPIDSRNLYRCNWYPRQMATDFEISNQTSTPAPIIIGGVALSVTPEQFVKVNGFSNRFLLRDADYYDFDKRLQWANYPVERSDTSIGRYRTYGVVPDKMNGSLSIVTINSLHLVDGLTTVTYELDGIDYQNLYTHIRVGEASTDYNSSGKMVDALLSQVLQTSVKRE